MITDAIRKAPRVYIIGNGGSFANAQHIANDLLSAGVKAYTMDSATLTAFANDHSYDTAFARWLRIVGEPGDLLIALSGSGKSPNILNACAQAEVLGMKVIRIFGIDRDQNMQEAEEFQVRLGHEVMKELRA